MKSLTKRTSAFNADLMRQRMWEGIRVPREILQRALDGASEQLDAMETKFFTKDGHVEETREVVAWEVRQRAQEQIFKAAGVYLTPKEEAKKAPTVYMKVDPVTGVMQLIVGEAEATGAFGQQEGAEYEDSVDNTTTENARKLVALPSGTSSPILAPLAHMIGGEEPTEEEPQVIKTRGKTLEEIKREAFSDD